MLLSFFLLDSFCGKFSNFLRHKDFRAKISKTQFFAKLPGFLGRSMRTIMTVMSANRKKQNFLLLRSECFLRIGIYVQGVTLYTSVELAARRKLT